MKKLLTANKYLPAALAALGIALLGTPAFAQKPHRHATSYEMQLQHSRIFNSVSAQNSFGGSGYFYPGDY
jgi:hypothetical protein